MQVVPKQASQLWQAIQSWLHPYAAAIAQWPEQAKQQSRCHFVMSLADQVAHDLMAHKPRHLPTEELIHSVADGSAGDVQHCAEHFLRNYYYLFPHEPNYYRLLMIFRQLVQKKLVLYELH